METEQWETASLAFSYSLSETRKQGEAASVFAGLDEIDWHQLEHAYGAADAVPGWLRSLASQEDESDTFMHLSLSLCHQGTDFAE